MGSMLPYIAAPWIRHGKHPVSHKKSMFQRPFEWSSGTNASGLANRTVNSQLGWLPQFCRTHYICWLVVYLHLWKIWVRQLGLLFSIYGKKHVPNNQPDKHDRNEILFFYNWVYPTNSISIPYITCCNPTVTQPKKHGDFHFFLSASNKRMDLRHASWHVPRKADSDPVTQWP